MEKEHYCDFCDRRFLVKPSRCLDCKRDGIKTKIHIIQDLPVGTIVTMNPRAQKDFYLTDRLLDMYSKGETITKYDFDFPSFFEGSHFLMGLDAGIVIGRGARDTDIRVKYFSRTGEWRTTYIANADLLKLREA